MTIANVQSIQNCLDDYMVKKGKSEIDDIEANKELARAGLMKDDQAAPGQTLRDFLCYLRDANILPQNFKQIQGLWTIKHSKTMAKFIQILQF